MFHSRQQVTAACIASLEQVLRLQDADDARQEAALAPEDGYIAERESRSVLVASISCLMELQAECDDLGEDIDYLKRLLGLLDQWLRSRGLWAEYEVWAAGKEG